MAARDRHAGRAIALHGIVQNVGDSGCQRGYIELVGFKWMPHGFRSPRARLRRRARAGRSEEHTSELQSLMRISYAVFCLKKTIKNTQTTKTHKDQLAHYKITLHKHKQQQIVVIKR